MLQALRQATAEKHHQMEKALAVLERDWTVESYAQLLGRWLLFLEPLEACLAARPEWNDLHYDFESRRKVPLLRQDLRALGVNPAHGHPEIPSVQTLGRALGCLYVMEGSTLGGQLLSRFFGEKLGLSPDTGLAYFSGYGALTGIRWKETVALLESALPSVADPQTFTAEAVGGACDIFDSLRAWLPA